jgi:hypothetical protein
MDNINSNWILRELRREKPNSSNIIKISEYQFHNLPTKAKEHTSLEGVQCIIQIENVKPNRSFEGVQKRECEVQSY